MAKERKKSLVGWIAKWKLREIIIEIGRVTGTQKPHKNYVKDFTKVRITIEEIK